MRAYLNWRLHRQMSMNSDPWCFSLSKRFVGRQPAQPLIASGTSLYVFADFKCKRSVVRLWGCIGQVLVLISTLLEYTGE